MQKGIIEEQNRTIEEQNEQAQRDVSLPGLLNKETTERRLEKRVGESKPFGLFYIDLNKFKDINDLCGHDKGDDLLCQFAQLLCDTFRREDDEGRVGGDEFIVMVDIYADIAGSEKSQRVSSPTEQVDNVYYRLRAIESQLLKDSPWAAELKFGLAIGCALFDPARPLDASTLKRQAEEAMYEEKEDKAR